MDDKPSTAAGAVPAMSCLRLIEGVLKMVMPGLLSGWLLKSLALAGSCCGVWDYRSRWCWSSHAVNVISVSCVLIRAWRMSLRDSR